MLPRRHRNLLVKFAILISFLYLLMSLLSLSEVQTDKESSEKEVDLQIQKEDDKDIVLDLPIIPKDLDERDSEKRLVLDDESEKKEDVLIGLARNIEHIEIVEKKKVNEIKNLGIDTNNNKENNIDELLNKNEINRVKIEEVQGKKVQNMPDKEILEEKKKLIDDVLNDEIFPRKDKRQQNEAIKSKNEPKKELETKEKADKINMDKHFLHKGEENMSKENVDKNDNKIAVAEDKKGKQDKEEKVEVEEKKKVEEGKKGDEEEKKEEEDPADPKVVAEPVLAPPQVNYFHCYSPAKAKLQLKLHCRPVHH